MEEKDKAALFFSGETNDWPAFKDAIQMHADKHDTTWLFEGGRSLAEFLARQIKEKTGSDNKKRKKALEREKVASDNNHVPTSVDAYTGDALKEWFADKDIATGLLLSLNKNRLANLGSNFTDYKKLGFPNETALTQAHKSLDMKYLRQLNRMVARLLHDAVFEPSSKVDTAAQTKLNGILRNSEVSQILRGAVGDDDEEWLDQPWRIPALQIWAKMYHKYEGMTDMLTGTMMEELAKIITCVTGDARHRRTIYEADQDFERFGKTLIANFKDTATLWEFLRASLRQCHIHKLSKVGKDKAAWAKADEYLTNLMDSDTVLTLDNTDEAIKRAQNYMQRQDNEGEKRAAFSSASDESNDDNEEVKALRAAIKEKDQRLSALQAKFDSFSNEQKDGGNKRKKPARKNEKECNYCKKNGKWFQGHEESECHHKKKDEAEAALQAIKEKRERAGKNRQPAKSEKKAFAAGAVVNKGPAAARAAAGDDEYSKSLPASSPHAIAFSTAAVLDQRRVRHGTVDTAAQLHVCQGARGKGQPILLKGITGDTVNAERADVVFPVTTIEGKRYAIFMRNQTLVVDKKTETLLSVAVLLNAGFDVKFRTGTKQDPTFGGYLVTPDGQKIRMIFGDNLWRLPMWSDPVRYKNDQMSPTQRNTLALVPAAAALEALAQPSLPDQDAIQLVHDMWCHPGNDKMEQIYKARRGRGFPRGFITQLRKFHCATCAVSKRTRRYRRSKRVKVAAVKRATQARTVRTRKPSADVVLNDSKNAEHAGEQEAPEQGSGTFTKQLTCHGCQRIFGSAQGLVSHLNESYRCPISSNYRQPTVEPTRRVLQRAEASNALHQISALASATTSETATALPALRRLHIDYAHSISIGVHKEKYFLLMTLDGIDFTYCSATVDRTEPESLIHEFMTLTRLKIDCIRYDGAAEFAKSATFKAFCVNNHIAMEETAAYTHTFNARAEGAVRIVKEHMRCLLRRANLPRRFWPYAMLHFCRVYAYWPDKQGKSAWDKLDAHGPHALCHDEARDLHLFGSYVTGHLPRTHPLVENETLDDRALEGVWLGNDLSTPMFWMYSFKLRKVVRLSDPRHFDHILPFLCPEDIPHRIDLSAEDICKMHEEDGDKVQRMPVRKSTRFRVTASGESVLVTPDSGASDANSGENSGELDTGEPDAAEQDKESPSTAQHKVLLGPKDYKRLKHGKDAPFDAELQYLKPQLLAQALVHHKFVMDLPDGIWIDEKTGKTAACRVMAVRAYSRTQAKFWYVDFAIISHADRCDLQLPVRRGTVKSVNHAMNLQDLFRQLFNHPSTLEDLGITEERSKQIMSATIDAWRESLQNPFALACVLSAQINAADARRKDQEQQAAATRAAEVERKALEDAKARGPPAGHFKQVIETFEPLDTIFDEIDLLEEDPPHRGVAMRNARFRPYWIQAEEKEWQGLWDKGVFKKWSRKDLLSNDRVFTSRYVYKLKRSATTGEVYRFKARLIVRGFQMEKGVDFDDSFSPTPGLAVGRFMLSLAVANDYELHACDIEQAFLQADKLPEGVNGRYFIQPPPGSPDANNRDVVYEVRRPLYGNPSSPRALHKTLDAYFMSEGFEHVGFEESVWVRPKGGKYGEDIYVSTHVDDCLICCKSTATMSKFKQELLTRFQGTDEGEVKEYLGCEVIRDRVARTGKMVQAGYAERVLRTFGMWNCNPVLTPLDPNVRLTKRDSPEVVDPRLHRRMRSIVGCLSYLVNMTRPDLAFTYSQLSKFVQSPGPVHLAAAERALAYLRGTYNEGITYCDPGEERRNKLTGWVDSDFAADPDTRKSMTGYLFSLNGGAVSWRSSRQGGVTLSSAEAEFVAASQAGQEAVYLRALLRGFNFRQVGATEIWEDNASCIMMSENPANRERTRHVDTRVHYLRELVRDGHVKLLKCAGPQNVADALTKSLPRPALAKHRQYMWGTRIPFSAFYLSLKTGRPPTASYNIITPCGYRAARAA